jgi:hypothetical protein
MTDLDPNQAHTVPIDETGDIATIDVKDSQAHDETIGLNIDGDADAAYAVDVGGPNGDGGIEWFSDEVTYGLTSRVSDGWVQAEKYVRVRVTDPATTGSEATLYLARGT